MKQRIARRRSRARTPTGRAGDAVLQAEVLRPDEFAVPVHGDRHEGERRRRSRASSCGSGTTKKVLPGPARDRDLRRRRARTRPKRSPSEASRRAATRSRTARRRRRSRRRRVERRRAARRRRRSTSSASRCKKTEQPLAGVVIGFDADSVIGDPANFPIAVADTMTSGYGYPTGYLHEILRGRGLVYVVHASQLARARSQSCPARSSSTPAATRRR